MDGARFERGVEAEALGHFDVGRVLQHDVVAADHDRDVGDGDVELFQNRLHVRVALDVDVTVRVGVPDEELLEAERRRRVARSDDDDVPLSGRQKRHSPEDERAHEQLAQERIGLNELPQSHDLDAEHPQVSDSAPPDERTAIRQHAHFARELSGTVNRDELLHVSLGVEDR